MLEAKSTSITSSAGEAQGQSADQTRRIQAVARALDAAKADAIVAALSAEVFGEPPFYFTPKSPMLLNIKTGHNGISRRPNEEIVIPVSSCQAMNGNGVSMIFTDRHAYTATAAWSGDHADLAAMIDWDILRRHDFARDDGYPDKMDRYQAEALAYRYVPSSALLGIACASEAVRPAVEEQVRAAGASLAVFVRPGWCF